MDMYRVTRIQQLRGQLAQGTYRIDTGTVADAVIRRASGLDLAEDYARLTSGPETTRSRPRARRRVPVSEGRRPTRAAAAVGI